MCAYLVFTTPPPPSLHPRSFFSNVQCSTRTGLRCRRQTSKTRPPQVIVVLVQARTNLHETVLKAQNPEFHLQNAWTIHKKVLTGNTTVSTMASAPKASQRRLDSCDMSVRFMGNMAVRSKRYFAQYQSAPEILVNLSSARRISLNIVVVRMVGTPSSKRLPVLLLSW